jgi:hypothetical protein
MKNSCVFSILLLFLVAPVNAQWTQMNSGLTTNTVWSMISQGSNTYAGTDGTGVSVSGNNGNTWSATNSGIGSNYITAMASNGSTIFAGDNGGCIYVSTNSGASWSHACNGLPGSGYVYSLFMSGSTLYAGINQYVWMSANNGANWTVLNTSVASSDVVSLAVRGSYIYAGTSADGIFVSANSGTTWAAANSGLPAGIAINGLDTLASNLFAGTAGFGVYMSSNNGATWSAVNTGLTNASVFSLCVSGNSLFASTSTSIFVTSNNGGSWTSVGTGIPSGTIVYSFVANPTYLFAGTWAGGVYRRPLSEMIAGIRENTGNRINLNIYPNPASSIVTMEMSGLEKSTSSLLIFDLLGKQVWSKKDFNAGKLTVDVSDLSEGIYFYTLLQNNKVVASGKLVRAN